MISILFIVTAIILITVFLWLYLFNIYEVRIIVFPEVLILNENLNTEISVIPLNSFGGKALFRKVRAKFTIEEGEELIKNFAINGDSNIVSLEANGSMGKIILLVEANYGLFPTRVEVPVLQNKSDITK